MRRDTWLACVCVCACVWLATSCVRAVALGNRRDKTRPVDERRILDSAQCKAICLGNYISMLNRLNVSVPLPNLMDKCNNDSADCSACLRGCSVDNSGLPFDCGLQCANNSVCMRSCVLVHDLYYFRPGKCPQSELRCVANSANSREECQNDGDCRETASKCCPNCGARVCTRAQAVKTPRTTVTLTKFQENVQTRDLINVEWKADYTWDSPLVSVLQMRQQHGADEPERAWRTISESTVMAAQIENIPHCQKYQYRVAAVTPQSRSAFSEAGEFVGSNKQVNAPSKPRNAEVTKIVLRDNKVDIELRWSPPTKSERPIKNYEVTWVKRMQAPQSSEPTYGSVQRQKTLKPNELACTISDLDKDEDFKISVVAVSSCGAVLLESEAATIFYRTAATASLSEAEKKEETQSARCPAAPVRAEAKVAIAHDGDLHATVSWPAPVSMSVASYRIDWRLESCVNDPFQDADSERTVVLRNRTFTHNTHIRIPQLWFTCNYEVQVRTIAADGVCHVLLQQRFNTPLCSELRAAPCKTHHPAPASPPPPENVKVVLLAKLDRFEALINWTLPSDTPKKYRVSFGRSTGRSPSLVDQVRFQNERYVAFPPNVPLLFDHVLDRGNAQTTVVSGKSMRLGDLEPNAVYVVLIQTLLDDSHSKPTHVYFATIGDAPPTSPVLMPSATTSASNAPAVTGKGNACGLLLASLCACACALLAYSAR